MVEKIPDLHKIPANGEKAFCFRRCVWTSHLSFNNSKTPAWRKRKGITFDMLFNISL
uniref:Uncharacterized protein n=1 Tax=Oryza brachyantha TaxID=4533 RepID=J3NC06_ORYBR